ncbi:alpha/beta fold hydrolase [Sphingosinithalassobacter sp. LHW66-3]|uniref:alpha/beta fold hydrolase n=1 Tax=Sphingosinithalassobacter sp. LHW66-3 TaxID=3424718 RepID=UPI003D6AFDA6
MADFEMQRVALPTGVELDVAVAGKRDAEPIILLHGFPESHRTWRHQIPALATDHFVLAPDQRGFARSSKPEGVENYSPDKPVADLLALADHFGIGRFTLVGHDWGGAIAWMAALQHPDRVARLIIVNAPHPAIFQKTVIEDPGQRAASQYIRTFRDPNLETMLEAMGLEKFFDTTFARHISSEIAPKERAAYLDEWRQPGAMTAMLNWYRASLIEVPPVDAKVDKPTFTMPPLPKVSMPTLVIWGMKDSALLPCQLDGLDEQVNDLTIARIEDAGHFVPWEKPDSVTTAMRAWLASH